MGGDTVQSYIQQKLSQGYTPQAIYQYLLSQGYTPEQLQGAFRQSATPAAEDPHHSHLVVIAALVVLILVGGGAAIFLLNTEEVPILKALDVRSVIITESYEQDSPIDVNVEIVDPSSTSNTYEVYLSHKVTDDAGSLVYFTQETLRLAGKKTATKQLFLPKDTAEGSYKLETEATVGQRTFSSSFSFTVEKEPAVATGEPAVQLAPTYRIVPEEETRRNRVVVKAPTLPEDRGASGLAVARLGGA